MKSNAKRSAKPDAKPKTPAQLKAIYTLGRVVYFDDDELHNLVFDQTGKLHISDLTLDEANAVINRLKSLAGQDVTSPLDRATPGQIGKIKYLAGELGWKSESKRLVRFLEERFRASHPRFLDAKAANDCIEALKSMLAGGRGERKKV
jgi:hypothetical protein